MKKAIEFIHVSKSLTTYKSKESPFPGKRNRNAVHTLTLRAVPLPAKVICGTMALSAGMTPQPQCLRHQILSRTVTATANLEMK